MIVLRVRIENRVPIEVDGLRPDSLAGLSKSAIENLPVRHGNRLEPAGELFEISGDLADGRLRFTGPTHSLVGVGERLSTGQIDVEGSVGARVGVGMTGGEVTIHGSASEWVGAEQRGGIVRIAGSVGARAASTFPGGRYGMRGGLLFVAGSAGPDLGFRMRRGTVVVGGDCDAFLGASMVAGTIVVCGQVAPRLGAGLVRGSLILLGDGPTPELLPTFTDAGPCEPTFWRVYANRLKQLRAPIPPERLGDRRFSRSIGDRLALNKGEILARKRS